MPATRVLVTHDQAAEQVSAAEAAADIIAPRIGTAKNQGNGKFPLGRGRVLRSFSCAASRLLSALFENEID